eukprot:3186824-Pyramimonas_sp.AAC.1
MWRGGPPSPVDSAQGAACLAGAVCRRRSIFHRSISVACLYDHPSGDKEVVGKERVGEPTSDSIDLTVDLTQPDTTGHHGTFVGLVIDLTIDLTQRDTMGHH